MKLQSMTIQVHFNESISKTIYHSLFVSCREIPSISSFAYIVMVRIFQDSTAIVGCPQEFYCRIIQNRARQAPSLGEKSSVEQIFTQG